MRAGFDEYSNRDPGHTMPTLKWAVSSNPQAPACKASLTEFVFSSMAPMASIRSIRTPFNQRTTRRCPEAAKNNVTGWNAKQALGGRTIPPGCAGDTTTRACHQNKRTDVKYFSWCVRKRIRDQSGWPISEQGTDCQRRPLLQAQGCARREVATRIMDAHLFQAIRLGGVRMKRKNAPCAGFISSTAVARLFGV